MLILLVSRPHGAVVNANPCQGLLVLFPSGHPLFLLRVLVHLSERVFEKFDEIYCV